MAKTATNKRASKATAIRDHAVEDSELADLSETVSYSDYRGVPE